MPGYVGAKAVDQASVKDGMVCVHCKELLKDPLQTEDGVRVCRSCSGEIAKYVYVYVYVCELCNI